MNMISDSTNVNDSNNVNKAKQFCFENAVINTSIQWMYKYNTFISELKIYIESINDYFTASNKQLEEYLNKTQNQTIACILSYQNEFKTKHSIHSNKLVSFVQESIDNFLKEIKEAATEGKYKDNSNQPASLINNSSNNQIEELQKQKESFQLEITNLKSLLKETQIKNSEILLNSKSLTDNLQTYLTNNETQIQTISTLNNKINNLQQEIASLQNTIIEKTTSLNQYKIQYEQAIKNNQIKPTESSSKNINEIMKNIPQDEQKDFEQEKEEYTTLQKTIDDIKAEINDKQKEVTLLNKDDPNKKELEKEIKDKKNLFLKLTKELIALKKKINDKKDKKK